MDYRKPVRKTYVENIRIEQIKLRDGSVFSALMGSDDAVEMWVAWVTVRSGLLPKSIISQTFQTERDAQEFKLKNFVGAEFEGTSALAPELKEYLKTNIDLVLGRLSDTTGVKNAGDSESPLAFDVLEAAGVMLGHDLTKDVLDFTGEERKKVLEGRHGDDWKVAAVFEYCWLNFPQSSPAYVAAAYQFNEYIKRDYFSAGYLWRDLENLVHGVEASAVKAQEMRKKAGAAGSERSAMARDARRTALMDAMLRVVLRNPDVVKLGEKAVTTLALSDSATKEPTLWRQGQGQADEYIGEIRRGEAGPDLQVKYHSLFPPKPPKRLP
ncbi:hypothetical protein PANO111632_05015 [Paracoccus nototheniae]|uniref:Uncharacterized protein n=1 Tax=Paracoccus nototheniae TaxID=2489002 RepID=A0ABW4DY41_9RHOB|nr:hypothetical protein [Paracoccus nototheniae]